MENVIRIKKGLDENEFVKLGYVYSIGEAGYISEDEATVIVISRCPYKREVQQYTFNAELRHEKNVNKLRELNLLEL